MFKEKQKKGIKMDSVKQHKSMRFYFAINLEKKSTAVGSLIKNWDFAIMIAL